MTPNPLRRLRWPIVRGRPLLEWTPRHDSLDPIWLRWRTWQVVARTLPGLLWRHPFGRRPLGRDLRRYQAATGLSLHDDHAFQEGLQIVYEYGIFGVGVVLALAGSVYWLSGGADPRFSTALVVWVLTMMGSVTGRTYPFPILGALLLLGAWA